MSCPDSSWSKYADHCYKVIGTNMNWTSGETKCNTYNATLVKIDNIAELNYTGNFLKTNYGAGGFIWVSTINLEKGKRTVLVLILIDLQTPHCNNKLIFFIYTNNEKKIFMNNFFYN